MNRVTYFKTGRALYAFAVLAIGIIHFLYQSFPKGLMPVPPDTPGLIILVSVSGTALVLSGILLLIDKTFKYGAYLAAMTWLLLLVFVHIPLLSLHPRSPNDWTGTFENLMFVAGACLLISSVSSKSTFHKTLGRYLLAVSLLVFGVQHAMYLSFINTLIPAWLPLHTAWSWLVMLAFFASVLGLIIRSTVQLTGLMLAVMFLTWVVILHLPRAFVNINSEPEWTSTFVALAAGAIGLLIAGSED